MKSWLLVEARTRPVLRLLCSQAEDHDDECV